MSPEREFNFLAELRYLTDAAIVQAERISEIAADWDVDASKTIGIAHKSYNTRRERAADEDEFHAAMARILPLQGEFFRTLDGFLALFGRISLILKPTEKKGSGQLHKKRAQHLSQVLGISEDHLVTKRGLRNKWMHFDEILDETPETQMHPQKFVHSSKVTQKDIDSTIRLCIIDKLTVHYTGIGNIALDDYFAAVRDIEERVHKAIGTWAARNREVLRARKSP